MIENIDKINDILNNDGVIAFVTDTVWGIGCLPTSEKAVKRIYEIKKRDGNKPLILMSNEVYNLFKYIKQPIEKKVQQLIKQHLPGALTLVLPKSEDTPNYLTSNMPTVGIRVPNNELFKRLCLNINGHVLATTSANISGQTPALTYNDTVKYLGNSVDYILNDEGFSANGTASTVVGVNNSQITIFRQGETVIS